jgi:beta-lactamase class A
MIPLMLMHLIALLAVLQSSSAPLADQFTTIAKTSGGLVGVFAQVIESNDSAGLSETERFPMQSVYKLPIAMAVLDQVDRKALTLNQKASLSAGDMVPIVHSPLYDAHPRGGIAISVRDLIRAAIVDSDGTASDVLLRIAGGSPRVTAYLRGLGIRDMTVATTERTMSLDPMAQYKNYSTPRAAVDLLKALHAGRGVSPASRALLLQDMADSTPGALRIKGLLPKGTVVAHKTGTDSTRNGKTAATNDIGIVNLPDGRHLALAVFVKDSTAPQVEREGAIARTAKTAWDHWTATR